MIINSAALSDVAVLTRISSEIKERRGTDQSATAQGVG